MATVSILEQTSLFIVESGIGTFQRKISLIAGETYSVKWNGKSYECICANVDWNGFTLKALGNIGNITGAASTGQPFVIVAYPADIALRAGCGAEVHILDGATSVTLSITQEREIGDFDGTEASYPEVYGICEAHCKYPVYTKQQIISILQQIIEAGSLAGVDATQELSVHAIKETNASKDVSFWIGTEAQYNALTPAPAASYCMARISANGDLYFCTNDTSMQDWHDTTVRDAREAAAEVMAEVLAKAYTTSNPPTAEEVGAIPADMLGYAKYSYDLLYEFHLTPTFVQWNDKTINTPYKAGLTENTVGFALCYGEKDVKKTIVAWERGGAGVWIQYIEYGRTSGWIDIAGGINKFANDSTLLKLFLGANAGIYGNKQDAVNLSIGEQTYQMYGTHNVTCGTTDIKAGTAATNGAIYQMYE